MEVESTVARPRCPRCGPRSRDRGSLGQPSSEMVTVAVSASVPLIGAGRGRFGVLHADRKGHDRRWVLHADRQAAVGAIF